MINDKDIETIISWGHKISEIDLKEFIMKDEKRK